LADAASEPGILPLLQETMVQLWDKRADQTLTLSAYQALGDRGRSGLAVAVARRADATLRTFTDAQTEIARRILLRLISFGEGRADTRRQQPLAQVRTVGDDATDFAFVLQAMVVDRLLTMDEDDRSGEPHVDLAHEIMITAWPTLAAGSGAITSMSRSAGSSRQPPCNGRRMAAGLAACSIRSSSPTQKRGSTPSRRGS